MRIKRLDDIEEKCITEGLEPIEEAAEHAFELDIPHDTEVGSVEKID